MFGSDNWKNKVYSNFTRLFVNPVHPSVKCRSKSAFLSKGFDGQKAGRHVYCWSVNVLNVFFFLI